MILMSTPMQGPNDGSQASPSYQQPYQEPPKKKRGKGCLWMILGALLAIILLIVGIMALVGGTAKKVDDDMHKKHTVMLKVTGGSTADVTYTTDTNGSVSQVSGAKLPWSKTINVEGLTAGINITAQNNGAGTVGCEIEVDGKKVKSQTAEGQNSSASCVAP